MPLPVAGNIKTMAEQLNTSISDKLIGSQAEFVNGGPSGNYAQSVLQKYGATGSKAEQLSPFSGGVTPAFTVPTGDSAEKYPYYSPFVSSNEELYAGYQSWYSKAGHGILKSAGLASTTFLNGTIGLIAGVGSAIDTGKFSSFYDNDFSRALDSFNDSMENKFPNYYTESEKDASWYSPKNILTANFLFDKVIKNLGFSIGAIGAGMTYSAALRSIGLFSKIASAGGLARTAELTESAIETVPNMQRAAAVNSGIKKAASEFLSGFSTLNTTQRLIASGLGTIGEAGFEALQEVNSYRGKLISEYVTTHGYEPSGNDLEQINDITERAGNMLFGLNTVLLTGTNYVQMPKILGSSFRAERALYTEAIRETEGIFLDRGIGRYVRDLPKTRLGKIAAGARHFGSLAFSPSEAFEELSQTSFNFGVENYYDKARKGQDTDFIDDALTHGYYKTLTTKEGLESMLIGGLSGGIFEIRNKIKANGITGNGGTIGVNSNAAVEAFNNHLFSGFVWDSLQSQKRAAVIGQERAEAISRGEILESRDLEYDYTHNYLAPRVKYGRFDLVKDDIEQYRTLGLTEQGLQQLKDQGIIAPDTTSEQFISRLDNFSRHADNVSQLYQSLNIRYAGLKNDEGKPVFDEQIIDKMVYAAGKVADYDNRIPALSSLVLSTGINIQPLLDSMVKSDKPGKAVIDAVFEQIRQLDVLEDQKDQLKNNVSDLAELTSRRRHMLKEYEQLKNRPEDYITQRFGKPDTTAPENLEISQRDQNGNLYSMPVDPEVSYPLAENIIRDKNTLHPFSSLTIHDRNILGELRITTPTGKTTFVDPMVLNRYNLTSPYTDAEKVSLTDLFNKAAGKILEQSGLEQIQTGIPESFEEKIALSNSADNAVLTDKMEAALKKAIGDFENIRRKINEIAEKEKSETIESGIAESEKSSGQHATESPLYDNEIIRSVDESAKKHIGIVFRSSTSEATDIRGTGENDDFHRRANRFLSIIDQLPDRENIRIIAITRKNQKAAGLDGLIGDYVPGTDISADNIDEGVIRLIFIRSDKTGDHFIDSAGKNLGKVGTPVSFDNLVYSTLPNTSLLWRNGQTRYISSGPRAATEQTAKSYQQAWRIKRTTLLSKTDNYDSFPFSVSRGIPTYSEPAKASTVVGTLISSDDLNSNIINIPTQKTGETNGRGYGNIIHNEETISMPLGRPVLQKGATLLALNNRKLTGNEKRIVTGVLTRVAQKLETGTWDRDAVNYLQSILFWKKPAADATVSSNQIWTSGGYLYLGSRDRAVPLITELINESPLLSDFLDQAYISVNNYLLTHRSSEPFNEITDIDDQGQVKLLQWKSYQHFLLDNNYTTTADDTSNLSGKSRSVDNIPLTTDIIIPDENADKYSSPFEQRYAILNDFDLFPHVASSSNVMDVISDADYNSFVDKNQVSKTLLTSIALKVVEKVELSPREEAILAAKTADINTIINDLYNRSSATPSPGESTSTSMDQSLLSITQAGDFVLDGTTLNTIEYEGKKLAKVAASFNGRQIMFGQYQHLSKKEHSADKKAAVLEIATFQIAQALTEEITKRQQQLTTGVSSQPEFTPPPQVESTPIQPAGASNEELTADQIFANLKPGNQSDISGGQFRKVSEASEQIENIEEFEKYAERVLPQIPRHYLKDLIRTSDGGYAWGMFLKGAIYLYENAALGTGYHEVFEAIYNMFLDKRQQKAIISEFKNTSGSFYDNTTGSDLSYENASDHQAKEQIAEEFRQYVLSGTLPVARIRKNFFQRLWDYIKRIIGISPDSISSLFKKISAGYYANIPVPAQIPSVPYYSITVTGLNSTFIHQAMQGITAIVIEELFTTNGSLVNLEEQKISLESLYDKVFERLQTYFMKSLPEQLLYDLQLNKISDEESLKAKQVYAGFINNSWIPLKKNWRALVALNKEFLRTLNIEFESDDIETGDVLSEITPDSNNREYERDILKISARKNASTAVKLLFATLSAVEQDSNNPIAQATLSTPIRKLSSLKLPLLVNYASYFNRLLYQVAGNHQMKGLVQNIKAIASKDGTYVRLYNRLKLPAGYENLGLDDWKLLLKLYATTSKQQPDFLIGQRDETGKNYFIGANQNRQTRLVAREWISALRLSKMVTVQNNKYSINSQILENMPIRTLEDKISFLESLGIKFNQAGYNDLSAVNKKKFNEGASAIYSQLKKTGDIATLSGRWLGISGPLNKLAEAYVAMAGSTTEPQHLNISGETVQNLILHNYVSIITGDLNNTASKVELLEKLPHLSDVFSKDSLLLENGGPLFDETGNRREFPISVSIIEGLTDSAQRKATPVTALSLSARRMVEFNQNLSGIYYTLVPADSRTEWGLNLGGYNYIGFGDFANKDALAAKISRIFTSYLTTEISLAAADRSHIKAVGKKSSTLRFFKGILSESLQKSAGEVISGKNTAGKWISVNQTAFLSEVNYWIDKLTNSQVEYFLSRRLVLNDQNDKYRFPGLDSDFTAKHGIPSILSREQLLDIIKFRTVNYAIHNIELHKVFFGDPALYSDPTKRIKSFLSGREITYHTDREFDTFANSHLNSVHTEIKDIALQPSDPGYHHFRDYMPSVTTSDIMVIGSLAMDENIDPKIRQAYANTNEADAQSWMRLTTYRELLHKAGGRWTDAMEKQFQYEMAYERVQREKSGTYKYTNRSLKAADLLTIRAGNPSSATFEIIKPIGSGVKYGATFADMFLDKTSTVPLFYRMVESMGAEKIYLQAEKSDVGYIITESGRKVGAESQFDLYDEKGRINESPYNNRINIPFKYFGIQQETASHSQGQPRGTQLTKIATMDLLQDSVPIDVAESYSYDQWHFLSDDEKVEKSPVYALVNKNRKILDALTDAGYRKVLSALDIKEENGDFNIKDFSKVVKLLKDQVLSRDLPSDLRQALDTDTATGELKVPLEALTNYRSLRSIIYSVVDKYLLSPKLNGGPKVQVSSAIFEKNGRKAVYKPEGDKNASWTEVKSYESLSEAEKITVRLSSSDLKFYSKDSPFMEVMLPAWFKPKLGANKTDEQILKYLKSKKSPLLSGIGFRIPTQALSSVERFIVKGFLPAEMGNTIMVPSEITVKAGSDFDIDKLNTYLRNFFIGKDGFPQSYEIVFKDTSTDQGLSDLFEIFNLNRGVTVSSQQYGIDQTATKLINQLFGTELEAEQPADNLEDFMILNRGKSIFDIYGRYQPAALENAYISTLEELISLPSNFERLIQPNSADVLKDLRDELNQALNKESVTASGDFAKLLDPMHLSEVRHNFLAGKDGVGIAALQQTNNALNQLTGVVLDHRDFIKKLSADQLPYVQDMEIMLPHNSVNISGQKFISLSSITDIIGKYISDKISAYINGYVDVAKDAFIVELGASLNVASTYLFLEKAGVATRNVIFFMNQPIIRQYLTTLEINGFASPISARAGKIIAQVKGSFPTSTGNFTTINIDGLKSNIERYSAGEKLTNEQNREQQLILDEFLKYSVFADHLFKLAQGSNYDTANFSDPALIFRKVQQTNDVRENNLFQGIDKILNGSFIGTMANRLTTLKEALGNIFVYDKPNVSAVLESVLKDYASSGIYLSEKDYISIASRLQATFTDYLIQIYGKESIGGKIHSLFYGSNAVADQLNGIKKTLPASSDLANNAVLQSLAPVFDSVNPNGPKNLVFKEKPFDGYSYNRYTEAFRELRDNIHTASLYQNLLPLTLLQTGTRRAQGSFTEILPIEDYAPLLSDILGKLEHKSDLHNFKDNYVFQRTNWSEDNVVPLIEPKLLESREGSWYPLFAVPSMLFENLKIASRSSSDFIQLHSWYQARELNFPVVKIRFVGIDPTTGEVFSRERQTEMRKNGDYSFYRFKLFQKVLEVGPDNKMAPLTYMDPEQRIPGSYYTIYKQINAWGKPGSIQEFHALPKPSILETNLKVTEFSDQDVISAFRDSSQVFRQTISNEKFLPSKASAKTIKKIERFLENIGVDVKKVGKVVVNGKKLDVNAVADITGKLIQVVYGQTETALPEEAMHFVVELIEQTNPQLFNRLIKDVGSYDLYKEIFSQYRDIYTTEDGRPDVRKIKKEAVARILVETIIKNNEGYIEKPHLLAQTKSWWKSILDWLKHLFSKAKIDTFQLASEFVEKPELHNKSNSISYAASRVNTVNASMKLALALSSDKFRKLYGKFYSTNPEKFYSELQREASKAQVNLLRKWALTNTHEDIDDMITAVISKLSYAVQIKVGQRPPREHVVALENGLFDVILIDPDNNEYVGASGLTRQEIVRHFGDRIMEEYRRESVYYKDVTVPGGSNYLEYEIKTPEITPAIKGHAAFSTVNGIGWFRTDQINEKTRRIIELQSDLFQRTANNAPLVNGSLTPIQEGQNDFLNQFHQNGNWIKFFIQAVVQDSAAKGFTTVRFPAGKTALLVEGIPVEEGLHPVDLFYGERIKNTLVKVYGKESVQQVTDEHGNTWNQLKIEENRDLGEFYYQLGGNQDLLSDKILNLHNQITKITNPNNPSESHYEIAGKKIEYRVTNLTNKFYTEKFRHKQLSETELQKALNEQKRDKGTDGHADLEDIFHNLVDDDGYLRDIPLAQRLPSRLDSDDNSFYLTLEQNLKERLHDFPAGTRFFSEVMIYDRAKDEAGTIDFLAIEPDNTDGTSGKIHILDWKFISLKSDATDIPWYKKEAWNIQLSEYRRILSTPDYGASKSGFGQTRAIPIKATYAYAQGTNDKLKLKSIQIGNNNTRLINDDTLLPVPSSTESTGNNQLDNLLTSLNSMVYKIYDTRSEPGKEYQKIERLNDLVTAIRRLQLKMSTKDLFDFAKADIKSFNEFSKDNLKLFDETSFSNLSTAELNRLSAKILDAEDVLSFYKDFGKIYRKIFDPFQDANKPLLREAEDISDGAEIVRDKLLELAGKLRTNPIALGANVVDLLQAEKAVTWYQKWVRSLSQGATKAVQILSSIINNINSRYRIDFSDEMERLEEVKKDVEGWMKKNGKTIKDLQRMFLGIDSKGNWNGKVISRTSQKYYAELEKAKIAKNKDWITINVDTAAYMEWYKQAYMDRVNSFAISRLNENDDKDKEIKAKRLELFEKQFDIQNHTDSAISQANLRLNSFPNLAIWSSEAYTELNKSGNEPVLKMYRYWETRLEKSYNLGIISAWEKKTFFPNVRKDFLDKMVFGSRDATFKTANLNFLNDIRVDANDQVYGYTDINGNPQDKLSAWYVYDLGQKVTTGTGDDITDYSQKSTDIFKVMALWNAEMIKYQHKSEVVDIVRLIHYTEQNRKAIARSKKTGGISYRADGEPVLIDNVENSAYFKNYMDFYFYGRKLSESQDVTFTLHYNKLAQKVNGFFKADIMPASSEEEIVISGKKTISAVNRFFQMKVLGVNLATAVTNYLGGKTNAYMLAGKHFTKADFTRASMQLAASKFHTEEGKVYAGLLNYFLPLTEDRTREIVRDQSVSAAVRFLSSDHLFYLMRTSDKMVQYPAAISFFDNTMIENGKLVNIREYVKAQKGYSNIYQLGVTEQKALRTAIEDEIDNLKKSRSLPKIAKIQADKITIEGIDRSSATVAALRNRIGQFAKDALGNMSEDDISQYRMTLLGQSFMMFKNWIPRMADVRFGEFRYQHGTESYEWGRISMLFNALKHGILTGATASLKTLVGSNDGLVEIARRVYQQKKAQVMATGEVFNMSEADFIDMYVKGIRTQLKEVGIMLGMVGTLMFAKAEVPDDDDRTKGFFKWLVRMIDKLTDELSFFMNPLSFTAIANGSVFPSVQVLTDIVVLMRNLSFEGYYVAIGDEKAAENNKVLKYLYKTFPVSKELLMYTAIFNEEIAKEYGISITTNARKR